MKFANFFQEAKKQSGLEGAKSVVRNETPLQDATTKTSRPRTGNDVRLPPNGEIQFIETDLSRELAEPKTSRPRTGNDVRLPPNGEIQTVETDLSRKLEKLEAQGVDVGEIIRSGGTLPEPKPDPEVPSQPLLTEPQVAFDIALPIPLDADGNPQIARPVNPETDTLTPSLPEEAFDIALPLPRDADGNPPIAKPVNPPLGTVPEVEPFDIALPLPLDADGNPPIAKPINPPTSKPVNPSGVPIELDIQFPPLQNDVKTVILSKPNVTPIVLGVEQPASQKPEVQAEATRRNIFNFVIS